MFGLIKAWATEWAKVDSRYHDSGSTTFQLLYIIDVLISQSVLCSCSFFLGISPPTSTQYLAEAYTLL